MMGISRGRATGTGCGPASVAAVTETASRSVIVTGGNRGIGRAIVERFVADGHKVAGFSRTGDAPEGALGIACDVGDPAAVDAGFATAEAAHGPVEVLVANAGVAKDTLILRMSEEDWAGVLDVNLTGSFRVAKRAARSMIRGRWGRIIFTGSVVGLYGSPGQVNYASSKAALVGLARSLTREIGSRGVTANVVAPGFIETDMTAVLPDDLVAKYKATTPAGRLGRPEEVAAAIAFLASEQAGFISGAVIPVDGGLGMGH